MSSFHDDKQKVLAGDMLLSDFAAKWGMPGTERKVDYDLMLMVVQIRESEAATEAHEQGRAAQRAWLDSQRAGADRHEREIAVQSRIADALEQFYDREGEPESEDDLRGRQQLRDHLRRQGEIGEEQLELSRQVRELQLQMCGLLSRQVEAMESIAKTLAWFEANGVPTVVNNR